MKKMNITNTMITCMELACSIAIVMIMYCGFREMFFAETLKEVLLGVGVMAASVIGGVAFGKHMVKIHKEMVDKEIEEMFEED